MTYEKQTWVDLETPIDAEHLNHMEDGISANSEAAQQNAEAVERLSEEIGDVSEKVNSLFEPEIPESERNLFNPANAVNGVQVYYNPSSYQNGAERLEAAQYAFSGVIAVKPGDYVVQQPENRLRFAQFFFGDADGKGVCAAWMNYSEVSSYGSWPLISDHGVTITQLDGFNNLIHIENENIKTLAWHIYPNQAHTEDDFAALIQTIQVTSGSEVKPFRPYGETSGGGLKVYDYSRLRGLKLVTAGDSITEGEGCENGSALGVSARPTYGYLAKEYYGMDYLNIAMGGRTMADVKVNGVSRNGFAVERYQLVPDDTDVLTMWFGYNDAAYGGASLRDDYCTEKYANLYSACTDEQKADADSQDWETAFLGSLDSSDTKTWSGAWNFTLNHFVVEKKIERIGVIIPYGVNQKLCDRLMEICSRYEVPYIKAHDSQDMPNIGYSNTATKVALELRARYTSDGLHPNNAGYERIARAYIPWLNTI